MANENIIIVLCIACVVLFLMFFYILFGPLPSQSKFIKSNQYGKEKVEHSSFTGFSMDYNGAGSSGDYLTSTINAASSFTVKAPGYYQLVVNSTVSKDTVVPNDAVFEVYLQEIIESLPNGGEIINSSVVIPGTAIVSPPSNITPAPTIATLYNYNFNSLFQITTAGTYSIKIKKVYKDNEAISQFSLSGFLYRA